MKNKNSKVKQNRKLNKKGFTLIEVVTCILLFAIGSVMLIGVIYTALQISLRASAKYRTQLRAAAGLELITSGRADLLGSGSDYEDVELEGTGGRVVVIFGNPTD